MPRKRVRSDKTRVHICYIPVKSMVSHTGRGMPNSLTC
jgi:hypothetical protein